MKRLKNYLRPFLSIKFVVCFVLAWAIVNGWSIAFIIIGALCDIGWMLNVGVAYQAFWYLPFTPEKLITIPMAMWFNYKLFKDEKNAQLLSNMKNQALYDWRKMTSIFRRKKKKSRTENETEENNICQD